MTSSEAIAGPSLEDLLRAALHYGKDVLGPDQVLDIVRTFLSPVYSQVQRVSGKEVVLTGRQTARMIPESTKEISLRSGSFVTVIPCSLDLHKHVRAYVLKPQQPELEIDLNEAGAEAGPGWISHYMTLEANREMIPGLKAAMEVSVEPFIHYGGLLSHQIESWEHFVHNQLRGIILENSNMVVNCEKIGERHQLVFEDVFVRPPRVQEVDGITHLVTPHECRVRGLSYNIGVFVNMRHTWQPLPESSENDSDLSNTSTLYQELSLCQLPCMLRSSCCNSRAAPFAGSAPDEADIHRREECYLDKGGYFIISGTEKCSIAQERLRHNFIFVRQGGESGNSCRAEIRSAHLEKTRSTSTLYFHLTMRSRLRVLLVSLPFVDQPLPVVVLLRLLGLESVEAQEHVFRYLPHDLSTTAREDLESTLRQALHVPDAHLLEMSREDLFDWVGKHGTKETTALRRTRYLEHILASEVLPHLGTGPEAYKAKTLLIALACIKVARVWLKQLPPDDRDDLALKRIETTGQLFATLFRQLFRNFLRTLQAYVHRSLEAGSRFNLVEILQSASRITSGFGYAMATGQWGVQKSSSQKGVVQMRQPQNVNGGISHLRRVNTPLAREGKLPKPRALCTSHHARLCAVETPEGPACGLVEVLALTALVRVGCAQDLLWKRLLRGLSEELLKPDLSSYNGSTWLVLVNGAPMGQTTKPQELLDHWKMLRRSSALPWDVSLYSCDVSRQLWVDSDPGCILRPLLRSDCLERFVTIVQRTPPPQLWRELLAQGVVDLVDRSEELQLRVSTHPGVAWATHVELHSSSLLGICAASIPFLNHNQAPRNLFQAAMSKQAMGTYAQSFERRLDTLAHILHYPQPLLTPTFVHTACDGDLAPASSNVVVAILCCGGYNQEDSIVVNRAALHRGLFRSTIFRTFRDEDRSCSMDQEFFRCNESVPVSGRKCANYSKLDADGLPRPGEVLEHGDVVFSKHLITNRSGNGETSQCFDHSTIYTFREPMTVDEVLLSVTVTGGQLARVRLKSAKTAEIGDKLSSQHAQKGVIGMIYNEEDMPFTSEGLIPDIIINPHAIPSRMTVAQLLEMVFGKGACCLGETMDGTPFRERDHASEIGRILMEHGLEPHGNESMRCGRTGRPFEGTIFMGISAYQRLRHVVADKIHARSLGPNQLLTRQPCEGRSRGGGLRFGEMEKDAVCAHGAAHVLLDRLMQQSDQLVVPVCKSCGLLADVRKSAGKEQNWCQMCQSGDNVTSVAIPAAARLLIHELGALNIGMRLWPETKENTAGLSSEAEKELEVIDEMEPDSGSFSDPEEETDETSEEVIDDTELNQHESHILMSCDDEDNDMENLDSLALLLDEDLEGLLPEMTENTLDHQGSL